MTRASFRFVTYTINHVPQGGVIWEAFCANSQCPAESGPQDRQETAQDWCLRHTAATGHTFFRRVCTDHAEVEARE